jgi:hypothetical protein
VELINRERKYYARPSELKAHEPESDIRCAFQSDIKDRTHVFYVRQQRVERSSSVRTGAGKKFRLCYFGHAEQWVNEENIRAHKLDKR